MADPCGREADFEGEKESFPAANMKMQRRNLTGE